MHALKGRFIVFDGPDGSGKSTQFHRFADAVQSAGIEVCEVREPGGTPIGEAVRRLLLDPSFDDLDVSAEMLLYMASRAQLVVDRIRPALTQGQMVLADRFVSSTLAYQGYAGGLEVADIHSVAKVACGGCVPDLVVIFDVDEATASTRLNPLLDRMEAKGSAFHRAVRAGYLEQASQEPDKYRVIDARPDADAVFDALLSEVQKWSGAPKR